VRRYCPLAPKAVERLLADWERLITFYQFPRGQWCHLRTSNVVESSVAAVRLHTTAAKRFKKVDSATATMRYNLCSVGTFLGSECIRDKMPPRDILTPSITSQEKLMARKAISIALALAQIVVIAVVLGSIAGFM
jgi:hypothetical protein